MKENYFPKFSQLLYTGVRTSLLSPNLDFPKSSADEVLLISYIVDKT